MVCFPFYMHVYTLIYIYVNRGIFDFFYFCKGYQNLKGCRSELDGFWGLFFLEQLPHLPFPLKNFSF